MTAKRRIGIIGAGTMGSLHARVVSEHPGCAVAWVSDPDQQRGGEVADRFATTWLPDPELRNVDAVIVAAPTQHHFVVANAVLDAGLPMLLEKPLADSIDHVEALVDRAAKQSSVLMCGLLERYNPAVRTAFEIAEAPLRISITRHSPFVSRITTGVASDLLIHDLDLAIRLMGSDPVVTAGRFGHFRSPTGSEDVADAILDFGGRVGVLSAARIAQYKRREMTIYEHDRQIDVDMIRQSITITQNVEASFDNKAVLSQQTITDVPPLRHSGEPLRVQLDRFLSIFDDATEADTELQQILPAHRVLEQVRLAAMS